MVKTHVNRLRGVEGPNTLGQIALCAFYSFLVEVETNPGYMRCMSNNKGWKGNLFPCAVRVAWPHLHVPRSYQMVTLHPTSNCNKWMLFCLRLLALACNKNTWDYWFLKKYAFNELKLSYFLQGAINHEPHRKKGRGEGGGGGAASLKPK